MRLKKKKKVPSNHTTNNRGLNSSNIRNIMILYSLQSGTCSFYNQSIYKDFLPSHLFGACCLYERITGSMVGSNGYIIDRLIHTLLKVLTIYRYT